MNTHTVKRTLWVLCLAPVLIGCVSQGEPVPILRDEDMRRVVDTAMNCDECWNRQLDRLADYGGQAVAALEDVVNESLAQIVRVNSASDAELLAAARKSAQQPAQRVTSQETLRKVAGVRRQQMSPAVLRYYLLADARRSLSRATRALKAIDKKAYSKVQKEIVAVEVRNPKLLLRR